MNENNLSDRDRTRLRQGREQHAQMEKKLKKALETHQNKLKTDFEREERLLNPQIKNNLIEWKRDEKNDKLFKGYFNEQLIFQITASVFIFTLKIKDKKLNYKHYKEKNKYIYSSVELKELQKIANSILIKFGTWS